MSGQQENQMADKQCKKIWSGVTEMKKIIIVSLVIITCMMMAGCKGKEEEKDKEPKSPEQSQVSDMTDAAGNELPDEEGTDAGGVDGVSALCTDDKSISITINRPEGFEDSEFSSEHQVAFQRVGADGTSSTQLNLRLMTEDENTVMTTAQQEVEYLLSANSDGTGNVGEVLSQQAGERQWSYFTYSLEGVEGYRIWTSLANGCVISCTAENLGSGLEPLTVDYLLQTLEAAVQE